MPKTILAIQDLSKVYSVGNSGDGHQALRDVTFNIQQGEIYGLIGMSGAGKSTLMRCLLGLEKPTSGGVFFHGQNIAEMSAPELRNCRREIGMVFQHFNLFPSRTAAENIEYPMEISGVPAAKRQDRVRELLELVGMPSKGNLYPSSLSGGEKQRIGIARALANNPVLLLCDEATSALDPNTMRGILSLLQDLNQKLGLSLLIITHQFDVVKQICHKIGVLLHGELIEEGSVSDLFTNPHHAGTRKLISSQLPDLPENVLGVGNTSKCLCRLSFKGQPAKEPMISRMLKRFNVEVNILQANLDSFQQAVFGVLIVEFIGEPAEREKALAFLRENSVQCEEIQT